MALTAVLFFVCFYSYAALDPHASKVRPRVFKVIFKMLEFKYTIMGQKEREQLITKHDQKNWLWYVFWVLKRRYILRSDTA